MLVADIRISEARSRMDMLPDYFEAAATSKKCLSGTRGSAENSFPAASYFWQKLLQNNLLEASHSATRSVPYISRRHRRPRIYNKVYFSKNNKRATLQGSPSVCVTVFLLGEIYEKFRVLQLHPPSGSASFMFFPCSFRQLYNTHLIWRLYKPFMNITWTNSQAYMNNCHDRTYNWTYLRRSRPSLRHSTNRRAPLVITYTFYRALSPLQH